MGPHAVNPATGNYYARTDDAVVNAHDSYTRNKAGAIVGFVLGAAGFAGFGMTFRF